MMEQPKLPPPYYNPLPANSNLVIVESRPKDFRSYVNYPGNTGLWNSTPDPKRKPYAHEFLHLLGLDDGYFDTYPCPVDAEFPDYFDPNCIKSNKKENYDPNDIAAETTGDVTQDDINALGDYIMKKYRASSNQDDANKPGGWKGEIKVPNMNLGKPATINDIKKMQDAPNMFPNKKFAPSNKEQKTSHTNVRYL